MKSKLKNIGILLFIAVITLLTLSTFTLAEHNESDHVDFSVYEDFELQDNEIVFRLFHSETCPHCIAELEYIETIKKKYPTVRFVDYEITGSDENRDFFIKLSEACGKEIAGVPTTFIGDEIIVGFSETRTTKLIESALDYCLENGCVDPTLKTSCNYTISPTNTSTVVDIPIIGEIDAANFSMPMFTFIIGLIDGFNPCAMWVLTVLLTLITFAKSRRKILLIGGIFALVSGTMYFLIMFIWLTFFLSISGVSVYIRWIMAAVAIIVGLINIKEFFWFKKGVSLTISEKNKSKLIKKMRTLVKENNTWVLIGSTITLAIFANLIELACTAGLPAVFTSILSMQEPSGTFGYYGYLVLYNVAYVLPLVAIVSAFAFTLGKYKFTETQGKVLKIVGGVIMLALGLILIFNPQLLSF